MPLIKYDYMPNIKFKSFAQDDIYIEPSMSIIPQNWDDLMEIEKLESFNQQIPEIVNLLQSYEANKNTASTIKPPVNINSSSITPIDDSSVVVPAISETKTPAITSQPSTSTQISKLDSLQNKGFQAPIKSDYKCSGKFSLSPTDPRHPKGHLGVDLRAPGGTLIYPFLPGIVTNISPNEKGGLVVNIDHKDGFKTYYAHCGTIKVQVGDIVDYNTPIATVGNSGNAKSTWPHLHFQVSKDGAIQDPEKYIFVPPYEDTSKDEKMWLSSNDLKEAQNFNIKEHASSKKIASKNINDIIKLANIYYKLAAYL